MRILVADDSETVHRIFRKTLQRAGFPIEMVGVGNGRDCLRLLGSGEFGLAFIDVFMPEMSGLEALGNARFMGNKTFVTLMSAYPNERCLKLARELNAYEFLFKPFGQAEIEAILDTYRRACRPMCALIVDDSPTQRRIVRRVLARSMFRIDVEETGDGKAALDRCACCAFDLVFLDCNMPGLDGIETLARLREREAATKVVMISAERNKAKERAALARGASAYLHKPFYPNEVDALLHDLFGLRSPRLMVLKARVLRRFDVTIAGRTVAVAHKDSGHGSAIRRTCARPMCWRTGRPVAIRGRSARRPTRRRCSSSGARGSSADCVLICAVFTKPRPSPIEARAGRAWSDPGVRQPPRSRRFGHGRQGRGK